MFNHFTKFLSVTSCLILASLLFTINLNAQNYTFEASSGSFTPLSGGTATTLDLSALTAALPIGFNFSYFGTSYSQLKASRTGYITFDLTATSAISANAISTNGYLLVAPLWDDIKGGAGADARYQTTGSAPNRVFTFQWLNWNWFALASSPSISFQVKLYETSNKIVFAYRHENGPLIDPSASIGLVGSTDGQFYSLGNTYTAPPFDINGNDLLDSKPASGQLYAFTPVPASVVPTTQASNITASVKTAHSMRLNWTNGNGNYRAVFMKSTSANDVVDAGVIADGNLYLSSSIFTSSPHLTGDWYCVYNGAGNTVDVSGLEAGLSYRVHVVEYNGLAGNQKYNLTTGINNPTTITSTDFSTLTVLDVSESNAVLKLDIGKGEDRVIFIKANAGKGEVAPVVDKTTYQASRIAGMGTQIGTSAWYCVFNAAKDTLPNTIITGLTPDTQYTLHVIDYNGQPSQQQYNTVADNLVLVKTLKTVPVTYTFTASNGVFTEISGGTAIVDILADDKASASTVPIGFPFIYSGNTYTELTPTSNGFVNLNPYMFKLSDNGNNLASSPVHSVIAPLWDDVSGDGGSSSYITTGTTPNRVFTIEFLNWRWDYQGNSAISYQIKLYEINNKIEFIYRQEAGELSFPTASIGLSFPDVGAGNFISVNNTTNSATVSSTVETSDISTKPATGQIFSFTPCNHTAPTVTVVTLASGIPVLTSSSSSGNQWFKDGIVIEGATSATYTVATTGTYTVIVSVDNCTTVPSDEKIYVIAGLEVLNNDVLVYPAPAEDQVIVDVTRLQSTTPVSLSIYDVTGRVVHTRNDNGKMVIPITSYPSGIYIIKLQSGNHTISKKLMKK